MIEHFFTLGLPITSTVDEIRKAYRTLAFRCHPDRGGTAEEFQKLQTAYNKLLELRAHEDAGNVNLSNSLSKVAKHFKNRDVVFNLSISFADSYNGSSPTVKFETQAGTFKEVIVNIPQGINSGQRIVIHGCGDDSNKEMPPSDLIIVVTVRPSSRFVRDGDNIYYSTKLTLAESILGARRYIEFVNGQQIKVDIPPGTQPNIDVKLDRKSTRLNSSHVKRSRMPSSA